MTEEHKRLADNLPKRVPLERWGPYLSERQWGTVREDYGHLGDAWNYFPFDHAHYRAYLWGEDGIGRHIRFFSKSLLCCCLMEPKRSHIKRTTFWPGK